MSSLPFDIDIAVQSDVWADSQDLVHNSIRAVLNVLDTPRVGEITIVLSDNAQVKVLNREYRGKNKPTNVLSFPAELPEGLPAQVRQSQLGDLLICAPVVEREASEQKKLEDDHWAHLTIHGILHLMGYDHEQPDEAVVMESLETEILKKIGVSDPYLDSR